MKVKYELVGGSQFGVGVNGAPDGLYINQNQQIIGNVLVPGTYKFVVAASATGFQRSYSSVITLTVASAAVPLVIGNPTANVTSIQDNTSFTISWSLSSGTATLSFLGNLL